MKQDRTLEIRIWTDVACPWCWIGERRLARALSQRPELSVRRVWRPFELRPDLPREGVEWAAFVREKWETLERAGFLFEHVTLLGAEEGLDFRFDRMARAPNTRRAHRVILAAGDDSAQWRMAERLFRAHFTEGRDIADPETLRALALDEGLQEQVVARVLDGSPMDGRVEESQAEAREMGVQGVPFFLLAGKFALTGAQPPEVFLRALERTPPGEDRRAWSGA